MRQKIAALLSEVDLATELKNGLLLTIGGLCVALCLRLFLTPADIAPGGVSGLAIILNELTGWPIGVLMLLMNIPALALGFYSLGRFRFLIRTLYVVILFSVAVDLMVFWVSSDGITPDPILNTLYGGVLGGIGSGLVYRAGGTVGGTSVVSRVLQLRFAIPISQIYLVTDGVIVFISGLVFGWDHALYAMIALFVWGMVTDYVLEGPSRIRIVFIVTDTPDTISKTLIDEMHIGVTAWPGQGMYTDKDHSVLFCSVTRPDVPVLKSTVLKADPNAFVVVAQGHETLGGRLGR